MEAKWSTYLIKTVNCSLKILIIIKIIKMILTVNVTVVIIY